MKVIQTGFLAAAMMVLGLTLGHADTIVRPDRSTVILRGATVTKPEAADNGRGMALLGGLIGSTGTVTNNAGITSVNNFAVGGYQIFFDRDVSDCIAATTVVGFTAATLKIVTRGGNQLAFNANRISDGALANIGFSVIVFCPK
jgi:hypothetical protein